MLQAHAWPGNVRELRNVVSRLVLFPSEGALPKAVSAPVIQTQGLREAREEVLAEFEKAFITQRLGAGGHNVSEAARQMNVSRQFLHRLMMRYGL